MRKKIILWLSFMAASIVTMNSCRNEDYAQEKTALSIYKTSQTYQKLSPWKEDEVYIKNVQKVFLVHAKLDYFENKYGVVYWDYAMSFGNFDESYLVVPIIRGNKVVNVMKVIQKDGRVFFYEKNNRIFIEFFNNIVYKNITNVNEKIVYTDRPNSKALVFKCVYRTITIGCPPGYSDCTPISQTTSECNWQEEPGNPQMEFCHPLECDGGGGGGGLEYPEPEDPKTPCDKTKGIVTNPKMQAGIQELKDQSTTGGEKGIKFKADGTPSATIMGSAHSVNFGDKTGYAGGYHNHTPTGIPMLSPPDIDQLLGFARAQPTFNSANVNNAYVGMVSPNGMHYVIWFNGTYQDATTSFLQENLDKFIDIYRETNSLLLLNQNYSSDHITLNNLGVEKLFFDTLKDMGLDNKVRLQRIESDGTIQSINLDNNNQPIPTPCS